MNFKDSAAKTDWELLSAEVQRDRRAGKRVSLAFSIEVAGIAPDGQHFREYTQTWNVSEEGCCFLLERELHPGDVVSVRVLNKRNDALAKRPPALFQVAWVEPEGDGWRAGARRLDGQNIWPLHIPRNPTHDKPST